MSPRLTAAQRIAQDIRNQIVAKVYKPGDKLPNERELAKHYGVSRIPVREAMRSLAQMGLVHIRHGSGNYVNTVQDGKVIDQVVQYLYLSDSSYMEIMQLSIILQGHAAWVVAADCSDETLEKIKQKAQVCEEQFAKLNTKSQNSFQQADWDFHLSIAQASGNALICNTVSTIQNTLKLRPNILKNSPESVEAIIKWHKEIISAFEERNPTRAMTAISNDLKEFSNIITVQSMNKSAKDIFLHTMKK